MKPLFFLLMLFMSSSCQSPKTETAVDNSEKNKALIETYFGHFNRHDWVKMADMYIETPEMKDPAYGLKNRTMTKAEIVKKYSELHQMIPDVQDKIIHIYEAKNHIIVEFVSSGTAPDGTKFELPICTIFEIQEGKISKDLTYYDNFEEEKEK